MSRRLLLTVAAIALALAFASLGRWQWQRGAEKESLLQAWELALVAGQAPLAESLDGDDALPQRVRGEGRFVGPWLIQDNQRHQGVVGLRYFRVMRSCCPERDVLVDLGWRPWGESRQLPPPADVPESVEVAGLLVPWPGQGIELAQQDWQPSENNEILLLRIERSAIETALGKRIAPRLLRLDPELPLGFARDLEALPNTLPPERHRGYAVQWFALSLTVLVVLILLSYRFRQRP